MSKKHITRDYIASCDETIEDVFNSLTDRQKEVVYYIVGAALKDAYEQMNYLAEIYNLSCSDLLRKLVTDKYMEETQRRRDS